MRLHPSSSPPSTCNVGVGEVPWVHPRMSWVASSFGQRLQLEWLSRPMLRGDNDGWIIKVS